MPLSSHTHYLYFMVSLTVLWDSPVYRYLLLFYFSYLKLGELRESGEDLLSDEVHSAVLGPQVQLPLEPSVGADSEA